MEMFADKNLTLKLDNGAEIKAEKALHYASGMIKDFLRTQDSNDVEMPIPNSSAYQADIKDFEFLNKFFKYVDENLHDELREKADEQNYWIEKIDSKKGELLKLADDVPDTTLMRCINLGDFLIAKTFVIFCSMVLHERVHKLKLHDLRKRFNEADDFGEKQRALISQHPDM